MNILYLKYAAEVAKSGSISKAAENLYVAQPNISRAVKELESSLGVSIFERTPKGMVLTPDGERLVQYAENILAQIDEMEEIFRNGESRKKKFSVAAPRASYISHAFARFSKQLPPDAPAEAFYQETDTQRVINSVLNADFKLGIIRYAEHHDRYFKEMLEEKGLVGELVTEFHYMLVLNEAHPLAGKDEIFRADLRPYTEIAHADPAMPSLPISEIRKEERPSNTERHIYVFERASQFEILAENPQAFMWVSPVPEELLLRFSLVQKECADHRKIYRDVLIYRKDYRLSTLDRSFLTELCDSKRRFIGRT